MNGLVEYRLGLDSVDDPITLLDLLTINPTSGVIQTAQTLDRERIATIRLKVIARDHGLPEAFQSNASVEIHILDANDNPPVFKNEECRAVVLENTTVPLVILTVEATDPDAGNNGKVHYSIVTSSVPIFSINYKTGQLTLREAPDPRQSPISLLLRAKDGKILKIRKKI